MNVYMYVTINIMNTTTQGDEWSTGGGLEFRAVMSKSKLCDQLEEGKILQNLAIHQDKSNNFVLNSRLAKLDYLLMI